jgi:division protein CdvB (Snf7/Vps24/ESCRT-III family)
MVVEVGEATGSGYDISTSSEEAQRIITEANTIAEQRMKERFPELPTAAPAVPTAPSEQTGLPR